MYGFLGSGVSGALSWLNVSAVLLVAVAALAWLKGGQRQSASAAITAVVAIVVAFSAWVVAIGIGYIGVSILGEAEGVEPAFNGISGFADPGINRGANLAAGLALVLSGVVGVAVHLVVRGRLLDAGSLDREAEALVETLVLLAVSLLFISMFAATAVNLFVTVQNDGYPLAHRPFAFTFAYGLLWAGYLRSVLGRYGVSLQRRAAAPAP